MHIRATRAVALAALILMVGSGCALRPSRHKADRSKGTLITRAEIIRSGATTVWEALQRTVKYTQFTESPRGSPERVRRRGPSTIVLFEDIPILMDGVRVNDIRVLDQIPAREIDRIQVLNGIDATTYYGTNATDGIILIFTRTR